MVELGAIQFRERGRGIDFSDGLGDLRIFSSTHSDDHTPEHAPLQYATSTCNYNTHEMKVGVA